MADDKKGKATPPTLAPTPAAPTPPATPAPTANGKKRRGAPPPENETKSDRFRRLANKRIPKLLKAMDVVKALATGSSYERTEEQTAVVLKVINKAYEDVKAAFLGIKLAETPFKI